MKILLGLVEGQVLQRLGSRGAAVQLSGESRGTGGIFATLSQKGKVLSGWKNRKVGNSTGKFVIKLSGIPAGGPYRLKLELGSESVVIKSFFVGDVWVLAGQSNMQGVGNLNQAMKPHPLIRAFSMRREWRQAEDPLHVLSESPDECHHKGRQITVEEAETYRKQTAKGVSVGIPFAREMWAITGVPQGLICTAHGGTSMAQWDPALRSQGGASLYYSMHESVKATGQPVAGVLWYQGESDCSPQVIPLYVERMKTLVAATRKHFGQPDLPWVIVQLGRFVAAGNGEPWSQIRELQRTLPTRIRRLLTVPAIDLSLDDAIHISSEGFGKLGRRLALAAASLAHGKKVELPQLVKIHPVRSEPGIGIIQEVEFSGVKGKLVSAGEPSGFSYVGESGAPQSTLYRITLAGNRARLWLNGNPEGWVGYGLGHNPYCNVTDERGLPLPAFGPSMVGIPRALLPYLTQWNASPLLPTGKPLAKLQPADLAKPVYAAKTYGDSGGFVNEHPNWENQSGQQYFSAALDLPERMKLKFLMGYDGPFRIWLDGKPLFMDLKGTNPAIADASSKTVALAAGRHRIAVAMDLNDGRAWGFFLRFQRLDVTAAQIRSGNYAKPVYAV